MASSTPKYSPGPQLPSYEDTTGFNDSAPDPHAVPSYRTGQATKEGQVPPYATQPPNMPPGSMAPPVTAQTVYVQNSMSFHDCPVQMLCPSCNKTIVTRVSKKAGSLVWLSCASLLLVGCWGGCCLIPFCVDSLQDVDHFCPSCNVPLGSYKRC